MTRDYNSASSGSVKNNAMGLKTPLYSAHVKAGAKLVDFSGWDMPVHYGSQIEEHRRVREDAGAFDVSHMTVVEIRGAGSRDFLVRLLANDIRKLRVDGKALYSAMLDDRGGILDDLIVYLNGNDYLMVVNCATREKDLAWMEMQARDFDCDIVERPGLAIIAVQGPRALNALEAVLDDEKKELIGTLGVFQGGFTGDWFIARTGYTGEKGCEIILPGEEAPAFWERLMNHGVAPVGLGARDTLRLEAGMNLYGQDMDETVTPFESNMGSTVVMEDHEFIGRDALRKQLEDGVGRTLIGVVMYERGVLRSHYPVFSGEDRVGEITSGAFSPTLKHAIGFARVSRTAAPLTVEIRNRRVAVEQVTPVFVRNGRKVFKTV